MTGVLAWEVAVSVILGTASRVVAVAGMKLVGLIASDTERNGGGVDTDDIAFIVSAVMADACVGRNECMNGAMCRECERSAQQPTDKRTL